MLKQRIFTALGIAGLLFAALAFLPLSGLAMVLSLLVALGAWEWARMAGFESRPARLAYALLLILVTLALYYYCRLGGSPTREAMQPFLNIAYL